MAHFITLKVVLKLFNKNGETNKTQEEAKIVKEFWQRRILSHTLFNSQTENLLKTVKYWRDTTSRLY